MGAEGFAQYAFRTFDDDGSGSIDFKEFMYAICITNQGSYEQKLQWAFQIYDIDHDNTITQKEMNTILKAICKMTAFNIEEVPQKVSEIFAKVDTDQNGFITYEEFKIAAVEDPTLTLFFNDQEPVGTCKIKKTEKCEKA